MSNPELPEPSVVVVSPTVGGPHLDRCIASVQSQTYSHIEHLVIADGPEDGRAADEVIRRVEEARIPLRTVSLPYKTGQGGFNGYRIATAFAYLVPADIVVFLDDDNWLEPDHVRLMVEAMVEFGTEWAFSLRSITREEGSFLVADNCDSLGFWRREASFRGPLHYLDPQLVAFYSLCPYHVDTSCLAIRTATLQQFAAAMLKPYYGDAVLATALVRARAGSCTGARTVNYRVRRDREDGAQRYFEDGNASMEKHYRGPFPWATRQRCEPVNLDCLR